MVVLETEKLRKKFKTLSLRGRTEVVAVDSLDLEVNQAEIFAFLGPNAAGKTTTIKMLIGVVRPTSGTIRLFNQVLDSKNVEIKRRIGYVPESPQLADYYKVYELMEFYYQLFNIPKAKRGSLTERLLQETGIHGQRNSWIKDLSMGQKRCLGLATALINEPKLLLLDEPTVYLDPLIIEKIRNLFLKLKNSGTTIFMSSHILSEVEKVCDRFVIIKQGKLLSQGITHDLRAGSSLEQEFLKKVKGDE